MLIVRFSESFGISVSLGALATHETHWKLGQTLTAICWISLETCLLQAEVLPVLPQKDSQRQRRRDYIIRSLGTDAKDVELAGSNAMRHVPSVATAIDMGCLVFSCSPEDKELDLLADYRPTNVLPPPMGDLAIQHLLSSMESDDVKLLEIPESKSRRMLELRLQQNFIEKISQTLSACHQPKVRHAWGVEVPKMALTHDNVLYGMLALSILYLLKFEPNNQELLVTRQSYRGLALRKHRQAVALLSSETADAVCYASTLVLIDAFACLQDRPLNPWTPPMEWIQMARGSGSVLAVAYDRINNFQTAKIMLLSEAEPKLHDGPALFADDNRRRLEHLLAYDLSSEVWDEETRQAYEKALNYIGGVQLAIEAGEHRLAILKRIMAFALLGPKRFYAFVEEKRPRALVILAHFFVLCSNMEDIWWVGKVAQREVQGIQRILPEEWQELMRVPLAFIGRLQSS
ncbi:hypothetical protein EG329_008971 [Mollisiaceae sp. DMI_Dod_QoI]|nr:hypothetical protein EG329_008971 [Helotiales sp. DMI_Dod_QoI]